MEIMLSFFVIIFVIIMVLLAKSLNIVTENQRIVIIRSGKYKSTGGPGLVLIVPFIDMPVVVNLTKHVPEWQSMTNKEINETIKKLVLDDPVPKKYK